MVHKKKNYQLRTIYDYFIFSIHDLKKLFPYILFSTILLLLTSLFGFFFPIFFKEYILQFIKDIIGEIEGLGWLEIIQFIMANNIQSAFFGMILGIFVGVIPLGIILFNGYILGFVSSYTVESEGIFVLWKILPHGIFELPAIIIAVSLGLRLGIVMMDVVLRMKFKHLSYFTHVLLKILSMMLWPLSFIYYSVEILLSPTLRKSFFQTILESFYVFLYIVIPLLVIAGIIEGTLIFLIV